MSSEPSTRPAGGDSRPADVVAGYLAALSIFASAIAVLWHPLRLVLLAAVLALVAAGMSPRRQKLAFVAVVIAGVAFFLGMVDAVVFKKPLW